MGSKIEWTDETWNPIVGCTWASSGCDGCYAARDAFGRLSGTDVYRGLATMHEESGLPRFTGEVRVLGPGNPWTKDRFEEPLHWKKPRRVFVNSMSDLFHPSVPQEDLFRIFSVMAQADQHTFQVLTKRPERMRAAVEWLGYRFESSEYDHDVPWPLPNVWLGTSIEDQETADRRVPKLLDVHAAVRFLSIEPLIGAVSLAGWLEETSPEDATLPAPVDWVIVGGESGPKARPMHRTWVRDLRDECVDARIPFHFKQWGEFVPSTEDSPIHRTGLVARPDGTFRHRLGNAPRDGEIAIHRPGKKAAGRELDGRTWDEEPELATPVS